MTKEPGYQEHIAIKKEAKRLSRRPTATQGCVCPPGAERTCQGPLCPRQKWIVS